MFRFASALVEAGRSIPMNARVDVPDLLPSHTAVRDGIKGFAKNEQDRFRSVELHNIVDVCGVVTSDGLKQKIQGEKYYDFTVHCFQVGKPDILTRTRTLKLVNRVILLKRHQGPETAEAFWAMYDQALLDKCGMDLDVFMKRFTFVTDCASTMPCIVGASSSSRRVTFNEKWMGCIPHQLNTLMKHAMESETASRIFKDLERVKLIVRIFKQSNWNIFLPDGFSLIQEIETRFGTTHAVVERFLKSVDEVGSIIASKESDTANSAFQGLLRAEDGDGKHTFLVLQSIVVSFAPIRHMQTALEASKSPTLHLVLPMLQRLKAQLTALGSGMVQDIDFSVPHTLTQEFCRSVLICLQNIEIHDLWVAGCMLHPRMRAMSFLRNLQDRSNMKAKGSTLIRLLMNAYNCSGDPDTTNDSIVVRESRVVPSILGESSFCLEDMFDTPDFISEEDERSRYLARSFSASSMQCLKGSLGTASFWLNQSDSFPGLAKVALRIFATPVSSSSSERNFSVVNRMISADRSRISPDLLEDLVYARSVMLDKEDIEQN